MIITKIRGDSMSYATDMQQAKLNIDQGKGFKCPDCGAFVRPGFDYCPKCGSMPQVDINGDDPEITAEFVSTVLDWWLTPVTFLGWGIAISLGVGKFLPRLFAIPAVLILVMTLWHIIKNIKIENELHDTFRMRVRHLLPRAWNLLWTVKLLLLAI